MATSQGALVADNSTVSIDTADAEGGVVGIQYGSKGDDGVTAAQGTVIAEASTNGVEWYAKKIIKNDDTSVDNLIAAGIGHVRVQGQAKVRLRMTTGGGVHGAQVWLNTQAT